MSTTAFHFCLCTCVIFCLPSGHSECHAQKRFELGLKFDTYSIPFNKNNTREDGLGYYEVSGKSEVNNALFADFSWWPFKHFGLSVGGGIHSYKYEVKYVINDPTQEELIFLNDYRTLSALAWGPTISLLARKDKWRSRLGFFTAFESFRYRQSHQSRSYITFIFDLMSQESAALAIDETIGMSPFQSSYSLIQFAVQREVAKGLFFHVGFESSWRGGTTDHYRLHVTGNTMNTTDETHELTDFHLLSNYQAFTIGVSSMLGFGDYDQ
jgi:hypothetical protein